MRNIFFAALFAFAILGTHGLSAAPAINAGLGDLGLMCRECCPPPRIVAYTATLSGEITDKASAEKVAGLIEAIDGVAGVTVDVETKKATITMEEDCYLSKEDIEKALKDSGFGVSELVISLIE